MTIQAIPHQRHTVTLSRLQPNGEPSPFTVTLPGPNNAMPSSRYAWQRPVDDPEYRSVVARPVKPSW